MNQQEGEAVGDRARAQHLGQRRVAAPLEGQAVDDTEGQGRDASHELLQGRARQMEHGGIARGHAGPAVASRAEHLGTTDEVAGVPVGQRDLAAGRRGVEDADAAGLDQPDAVVRRFLREQGRTTIEDAAAPPLHDLIALGLAQPIQQRTRSGGLGEGFHLTRASRARRKREARGKMGCVRPTWDGLHRLLLGDDRMQRSKAYTSSQQRVPITKCAKAANPLESAASLRSSPGNRSGIRPPPGTGRSPTGSVCARRDRDRRRPVRGRTKPAGVRSRPMLQRPPCAGC